MKIEIKEKIIYIEEATSKEMIELIRKFPNHSFAGKEISYNTWTPQPYISPTIQENPSQPPYYTLTITTDA